MNQGFGGDVCGQVSRACAEQWYADSSQMMDKRQLPYLFPNLLDGIG